MNADISPRTSRGPHHIGAQVAGVSRVKRVPTDIVERALLWVFIAGLAWCPVWFGSVTLLAWGINAVLFSGLVAIYELSLLIRGERHPVAMKQIKAPAALFAAVVLWILIQNATWTPDWLHHPIWQMTADELDRSVAGSISVDRDLTSLALLRLTTAASVFWIALQLCRNASRANILLKSVAALSCAYAAYGLFAFVYMPGRVLWVASPFPRTGFITSTFINPNSFATYAGMGLVVICGLILRLYRHEFMSAGGSMRFRIATFMQVTGQKGALLFGAALVVFVALLLSQSRGGILSTGSGLFVLAALSLNTRKRGTIGLRGAIILLGGLLVAGAFFAFGDLVAGRIMQGLNEDNRIALYTIAMRSIFESPLLGYGYGTFADVFPMFRDQSMSTFDTWVLAHNTYLEVFQGLGLLFGSMLVASIALLAQRCVKGAMNRQENEIACIAAGIAFLVGAHSLIDFSLQIQAVGVTFMALLGVGVAQSQSSRLMLAD
ncbi:MAG: O-antigen ligase family protein [Pseudolabrys sp.]